MGKWWDKTDKIELLPTSGQDRIPQLLSPTFAWPESIHEHWERMYQIRKEAYEQQKKYRNYLPRKKKHLALYRRAWDNQFVPAWVANLDRSELRIGLCIDDNRRPIAFEEACKDKARKSAEGIAHRKIVNKVRKKTIEKRDKTHLKTKKSLKWFSENCKGKFVYWEIAVGYEGEFKPRFADNRLFYVSRVYRKIHNSVRCKFYVNITLVDEKMRMYTLDATDFKAWVEDGMLYITEWPYESSSISESRPIKRQRLVLVGDRE